uniref:Proteasome inhibitor PI31 subunit n=1 Tax=Guillardia theta TaxID=55529 RepID=A0A7S4KNB0_GUITH|mmetsp:Transcript_27373/g.89320  ORF Transcript_27373/g.89320 Transcript_27373/m.89320 type:complete len:234 (+) Transcript_27373:269-970(+)
MCDDGGKNVKVQVNVKLVGLQDLLLVHAASDNVQDVFFLELRISDFVQTLHSQRLISDYEKIYTDLEALLRAVRINITYKLLPSLVPKKPSSSQHGCAMQAEEVPRSGSFPWRPEHVGHPGGLGGNLAQVYTDLGRTDLMPGGGLFPGHPVMPGMGAEGNLFGPRHPAFGGVGPLGGGGSLAGGSLAAPPGARVDPFGPPGVFPNPNGPAFGWTRREIPDDIFQPPGGDDMFM